MKTFRVWSVTCARSSTSGEELTSALGQPARGRLCLAGELFRLALDMMRGSFGPKRAMYFSRVPDATSNGEEIEVSLERLVEQ
jgi:hypothetical protein